jgi:hypothetical protein
VLGQRDPLTAENGAAIKAYNLLSNGMGGIDWAGLDVVVEMLGIEDVEALIEALLSIRLRPRRGETETED